MSSGLGLSLDVGYLEADLLMEVALSFSRESLLTRSSEAISTENLSQFQSILSRRLAGEPVAYIQGKKEFFGRDFRVNPSVLIPRPETELLVEESLRLIRDFSKLDISLLVLEVGVGSGAVISTLVLESGQVESCSEVKFAGFDISKDALHVAQENLEKHSLENKVKLFEADLFSFGSFPQELRKLCSERSVILVSNPPYIPAGDKLEKTVANFEPSLALRAGEDGLNCYRGLASLTGPLGCLAIACEIGMGQSSQVVEILAREGMIYPLIHKDLAGIERIVSCRRS